MYVLAVITSGDEREFALNPFGMSPWQITIALACALQLIARAPNALAADEPGQAVSAGEIRELASKHLKLLTDLAPNPEIDALPGLFDQAFGSVVCLLRRRRASACRLAGALLADERPKRFRAAGLMPADLRRSTAAMHARASCG